ncbi:hypothetical protein ACHAXT_001380 [Thalassiosira profunda]
MGACQGKQSTAAAASTGTLTLTPKNIPPITPQDAPDARESTPVDFLLSLTENKPLDAADVTDLAAAKAELRRIREFAKEFLDSTDVVGDEAATEANASADLPVRGALYDKQDFESFEKKTYDKSEEVRGIIYDAIKPNVLFEHDSHHEILEIIDVFKPQLFKAGETVIRQGDEGSEFYVVESGKLSIHVTVKEGEEKSEVKVGDYARGSAFGELALIFGSPRAATIVARTDCKLWCIERTAYRSVISQLRFDQYEKKRDFIRTCVVGDRRFTDIFDGSQLDDLTIATKTDVYEGGEVILREGEMGDTFYIVQSGTVEAYKKNQDGAEEKHRTIESRKTFGTTSLLKNVVSPLTYKAVGRVHVFYLTRQDYESILGSFQDALDGNTVSRSVTRSQSKRTIKTTTSMEHRHEFQLDELDAFNLLGRGAFGQVTLVEARGTKKVFALKAQSKHYIAKKGQKEHVLNEYRILREIEHPCILGIHCAMQDDKYLYFLLDLLPGGELMPYLVKRSRATGRGFAEDAVRFYAATVVLAFEHLHSFTFAYRDLKPENVVLNRKGYGVLVDFGLAKEIEDGQTYTFCGTPDYLAPEIIRGTGHDWAVDCWGLGVFLFEMANGTAPFFATNQARRTRKILKGFELVRVPSHFSSGLTDLIANLLISDPSKRLGRTQNGIKGIINHRWFAGFDWEGFNERKIKPPVEPNIPSNIRDLGKKKADKNPFQEAAYAPESDWWPDLKNMERW